MTWWQDALYGRSIMRPEHVGGVYMRSRSLELEELLRVADQIDEWLQNLSEETWVQSGQHRPQTVDLVRIWSDDGVVPRDASADGLTALTLRTIRMSQDQVGLHVGLEAGSLPNVATNGPEHWAGLVAQLFQAHGRPRVWWQRWPGVVPYLAYAAALAAGLVALLTTTVPAAWAIAFALFAALMFPGVRRSARELRDRTAFTAPGMLVHPQPRAELRASRASRRADLRIGLLVAIPAAVLGAVLQGWLGG